MEELTINQLLERLNISPTYDDYRELTYRLVQRASQISTIKIEIAKQKEELKNKEADEMLKLKSGETKITVAEAEAKIRQAVEQERQKLNNNLKDLEELEGNTEAMRWFLKAVDGSLFALNSIKDV